MIDSGEGGYRVLEPPGDGEGLVLDRSTFEPIAIAADGHEAAVSGLRPGYLVDAELDWSTTDPTVAELSVARPTLFAFVDGADPMFEVARETWETARAAADAMNARVTRNTDGEVNGAVYAFADADGERFAEFRDGRRPLEPLLDRVNDREGPAPREAFVLRAPDGEFTAVAIVLRKDGQFADVLRDTYDAQRPEEPLLG